MFAGRAFPQALRIIRTLQRAMATQNTRCRLNTGAEIPAVGFGTWRDAEAQSAAVLAALKAGYRHIDTARIYRTESAVGKAIKESGIPRNDVFVTTKLWNNSHRPEDVEPALDASLRDLGLSYVDLYLMHWPAAFESGPTFIPRDSNGKIESADIDYVDTYRAMEKLLGTGKTKAIGICNFSRAEMERLLAETSVVPAAHQIELHPWLQQRSFLEFHEDRRIHVIAYSPFGNQNEAYGSGESKLIDDPVLVSIGKRYNKTGAQAALAWGINRGHSVIPKSKTPSRIQSNLECDFKLTKAEMQDIESIDRKRRFNDPSSSFGYNFFADLDGK